MSRAFCLLLLPLVFFQPARASSEGCKEVEAVACVLSISIDEEEIPILDVLTYRSYFLEDTDKSVAVYMLCNALYRLSCSDAQAELSERFASLPCKNFFVAVVDGNGQMATLLGSSSKIVFAVRGEDQMVYPVRVSTPDEDTTLVNCGLISSVLAK